jgi:hypothetical protein
MRDGTSAIIVLSMLFGLSDLVPIRRCQEQCRRFGDLGCEVWKFVG